MTAESGSRDRLDPWLQDWSPEARALAALVGGTLFTLGLTRRAPWACILGTAGLALAARGLIGRPHYRLARPGSGGW
jgi:hypothetical protein